MAWPPVAADLYVHGPAASYFTGLAAGVVPGAILAAYGELATALGPRCGGDPASWTWAHTAGQEAATRDVCTVAVSWIVLNHGLTLPDTNDTAWLTRAEAVRAMWTRMGTPGVRPAAPLYAGLADATPDTTEGAARGWSTASPYEGTEDAA